MMNRVPEPEVWTAQMRDFMHHCVASTPDEECDRVREAANLLQHEGLTGHGASAVDADIVEQMLACGAVESAVLTMLKPGTVFMVSRGQEDCCLATVLAGENGDEVIAEAATLALALLSAYVAGLVAGVEHDVKLPCAQGSLPIARLH